MPFHQPSPDERAVASTAKVIVQIETNILKIRTLHLFNTTEFSVEK